MNNKSKTLPGQNKAPWRVLLLIAFLTALVTSCAHQPWDIDTYIINLERPERDVDQQPEKVVEALDLKPGMVVADVGAASGFFTRRFAKAVGGTGQVIVVDIEQKMLDYTSRNWRNSGWPIEPDSFWPNRTILRCPKIAWTWSFYATLSKVRTCRSMSSSPTRNIRQSGLPVLV
jgi:Methyltransferase domain